MKIFFKIMLALIFGILFIISSNAKTVIINCQSPKGDRVDYFTQSFLEEKKFEFLQGYDGITKGTIRLIWDQNSSNAYVSILDTTGQITTEKFLLLLNDYDQWTFFGLFKHAPLMISIYPLASIMIYSQQSTQSAMVGDGAKGLMFYAKCSINEN